MLRVAVGLALSFSIWLGAQDTKPADPAKAPQDPQPKPPNTELAKVLKVKTTKLFPDPGDAAILETLAISDIGRVALVVKTKDGKHRVILNGREQKPYSFIVPMDLMKMVRRPGAPYDPNSPPPDYSHLLRWDPAQKRVYYVANNAKGYVVASDNFDAPVKTPDFYESKVYDFIMDGMPLFSPDSKKIAFAAGKNSRWFIVLDNKASEDYDDLQIGTLAFSKDSKRLAYCARKGGMWRVVHDTGSFQAFEGVAEGSPLFSPDSQRIAYVALKQNKWKVLVDGQEYGTFDAVSEHSPVWSPDSKRLAYVAKRGTKWFVYVDNRENGPYDAVAELTPEFSRDSKRVAWAAQTGGVWAIYENGTEYKIPMPKPKKPEPLRGEAVLRGTPTYTPDGKKLVFGIKRQGSWTMWVEGEESAAYEDLRDSSLVFTKDSKKIVFVGLRDKKLVPVINFKELAPCSEIGPIRASRGEGTGTVAFGVRRVKTPKEIEAERKNNPRAGDIRPDYWSVVVDGEDRYGPYDDMQSFAVTVSPKGTRIAYPAMTRNVWGLWIDGVRRTDALPIWIGFNAETDYLEMVSNLPKEGYCFLTEILE
jgi:Tol biopolymer transport system component